MAHKIIPQVLPFCNFAILVPAALVQRATTVNVNVRPLLDLLIFFFYKDYIILCRETIILNVPILVLPSDGEGCSGTFCTLVTLLDRLEQDGVIDVFQAVKKLRSTRAGMVKTLVS